MKTSKSLLALAPMALLTLASCGGGIKPTSNASTPTGSEAAAGSQTPGGETDPKTAEDYFSSAKKARKATSEADNLRIYTPHANVKDGIAENGYLQANMGFYIDSAEEEETSSETSEEGSAANPIADFGLEDMEIGISVDAMPFDFRVNGMQGPKEKLVASFQNSIEERDGAFNLTTNGRNAFSNRFTTEYYVGDDKIYTNLSSINALLVLFGGSDYKLPGKGRMSFDLPHNFSLKDVFFLERDEGNDELFDKIDQALKDADIAVTANDLIDLFGNLDYELYKHTASKFWSLSETSIKLSVTTEPDFKDFFLALYDSRETDEEQEVTREQFSEGLDKTLDYIDFDHLEVETRFSDKGVTYNRMSFKINSFASDKAIEVPDTKVTFRPSGSWSFDLGLSYQYEDVAPKTLSEDNKAKYQYMGTDEIYATILKAIREAGKSQSEESSSESK